MEVSRRFTEHPSAGFQGSQGRTPLQSRGTDGGVKLRLLDCEVVLVCRTFAIGDVHGHAAKLQELLVRLRARATEGDTLVFLGDYVDRGPESRKAIDVVLEERSRWPGPVVALKGNHEAALLALREEGTPAFFRSWLVTLDALPLVGDHAATVSLESFRCAFPAEHRAFLKSLTLWHEDDHAIYVHAGLAPGL